MVYAASGLRKVTLSFVILLLLPFWISLGPMLFQRVRGGLIGESIAFAMFAVAFTAVLAMLVLQLVHSVRSRAELGPDALSLTLPIADNARPRFAFQSKTIPYADVVGVETRGEIYGGVLAPVLLRATRVRTRDGRATVLGYVNDGNVDAAFPFTEIGAEVARRAGINVADRGIVRRSVRKRVLGLATDDNENTPVPAEEIAAINARHASAVRWIVAGLALLVVSGITIDVMTASDTTFATLGAEAPTRPAPKR
jgi:hypothetical protein